VALLAAGLAVALPLLEARWGFAVPLHPPTADELRLLCVVLVAGTAVGALPAFAAYRRSLADGLSPGP
jgi:putative ABC transport system permease protein